METLTCSKCGKSLGNVGVIMVHATNGKGEKICYDCCADIDKHFMREHGHMVLYLHDNGLLIERNKPNRFEVINWPGTLRFPVTYHKTGRHNIARKRYDVWFIGPDGKEWHGVQYGDNTQQCRCKRTKHA